MKEKIKKIWRKFVGSKKVKRFFANIFALIIIIVVTALLTVWYCNKTEPQKENGPSYVEPDNKNDIVNTRPTVDLEYMSAFLEQSSELTTGKLKTQAYLDYSAEKGIPWLSKVAFGMIYEANLRAGIHLDEVKIHGKDDESRKIYITLPKAKILDASVDPETIKYIDEKFVIFPANEKEHANKAQAVAEEDALKYGKKTGILEFADDHARTLFNNFIKSMIEDYTIEYVPSDYVMQVNNYEESTETPEEAETTEKAETSNTKE